MRSSKRRPASNSVMARVRWCRLNRIAAAGALSFVAGCANECPWNGAGPLPDETNTLFNGTNLDGWVRRGGQAVYTAEDGCIVGRSAPHQPNTFLCTSRTYRDFDLELDFKVDPQANSGVQIRSEVRSEKGHEIVFGYQVEIDPSPRAFTGGLYDEARRGWLVDLKDKPEAQAAFHQGQWNHLRIVARGDTFNTWLNGVPVVKDFRDATTREGFIGLQVHSVGDRSEPREVRWMNLTLREIP